MTDESPTLAALSRAGKRAAFHLVQALVESLKAVEAVLDELGAITDRNDDDEDRRQRIEIE